MFGCRWAALNLSILFFFVARTSGAEVVCPVCGEVLENGTDECPNDGTDLTLVGKNPSEADDTDTPGRPDTPQADESTHGQNGQDSPLRYKRQDEGGERQIAPRKERSGFSDRESRLPEDDRMRAPPRPKKPSKRPVRTQPDTPRDDDLVKQFEKKRRYSWESRENARLITLMAKADKATARRRLLATLGAPLASLGVRLFWMKESEQSGLVTAAEIDVNLVRYRIRAGFSTLLGIRSMSGPDDLVFLESLDVGAQWPSRFSPFVLLKGGLGMLLLDDGKSTEAILLGSVGAEIGLNAWVNPWLSVTPSFGYMGNIRNHSYGNSFTSKVAIGF